MSKNDDVSPLPDSNQRVPKNPDYKSGAIDHYAKRAKNGEIHIYSQVN